MRQYLFLIGFGEFQIKKIRGFETPKEMKDHAISLQKKHDYNGKQHVNVFPIGEMALSI